MHIVIIGGGIAGLSAAARLAGDADVTLLEAEDALGYHASGRSAALLEITYGATSVQALSRASVDYLRDHDGGYLSPRGLLLVAQARDEATFRADVASMSLEEISVEDALAWVPILDTEKLSFAAHHADTLDIDTDRLLQGYARKARQLGARIITRHKVTGIGFADNLCHVVAGDASYVADIVVNAAGAWADQVAKLAGIAPLGITPYRRSMARIPAPDCCDIRRWPVFFGVGESWYAKPDAGSLLVSPADEDPVEPHDAWAEELTLARGLASYENVVTDKVRRLQSSWAGLRSFAPDRTLVLGPDPAQPAFVWCAGQGGYGVQTSPAASQLVCDLVMGRATKLPNEIVAQLKPDRLR